METLVLLGILLLLLRTPQWLGVWIRKRLVFRLGFAWQRGQCDSTISISIYILYLDISIHALFGRLGPFCSLKSTVQCALDIMLKMRDADTKDSS